MKTPNKWILFILFITAIFSPPKIQAQYDTLLYEDFNNPLPNNGFANWYVGDGPDLIDQDGVYSSDSTWAGGTANFSGTEIGVLGLDFFVTNPPNYLTDTLLSNPISVGDSGNIYLSVRGWIVMGVGAGDTTFIFLTVNDTFSTVLHMYIDTNMSFYATCFQGNIGQYLVKGANNTVRIGFIMSSYNDGIHAIIDNVLLIRPSVSDMALTDYSTAPYGCSLDSFVVQASFKNVSNNDTVVGFVANIGSNGTFFATDTINYLLPPGALGSYTFGPFPYSLFGGDSVVSLGMNLNAYNSAGQWDSNNANDSLWHDEYVKMFVVDTLTPFFETFDTLPSWNADGKNDFGIVWLASPDSGYRWFVLEKDYGGTPYYSGGLVQGDAPRYGDHTKWQQNFGKFAWLNVRFNNTSGYSPATSSEGAYFLSPWLNLKNSVAPSLKFWYYSLGISPGTKVLIETWDCASGSWITRDSLLPPAQSQYTDAWLEKNIMLYDLTGKISRLKFRFVKDTPSGSPPVPSPFFGIDDIQVSDSSAIDLFVDKVYLPEPSCFSDSERVTVVLGNNTQIAFNNTLSLQVKSYLNNTLLQDTLFTAFASVVKNVGDTLFLSYFDFSVPGNYTLEISLSGLSDADTTNNFFTYRFVHLGDTGIKRFSVVDFEVSSLGPYSPIGNTYAGWQEGTGDSLHLEELQNHGNILYMNYPYGSTRCALFKGALQTSYLLTPAISVTDSGSYFYYSYDVENVSGTSLKLLYTEDCGRTWKVLKTYGSDNTNVWKSDTVYMDSLVGKTIYIGFSLKSSQSSGNIGYVDNIGIFQKYKDLSTLRIKELTTSHCWGEDTLYVSYKNTGYYDFATGDSLSLVLEVGDSTYSQTFTQGIARGDSVEIPFAIFLPRDNVTSYNVKGIVSWAFDELRGNDTLQGTLIKYEPFLINTSQLISQDSLTQGDSLYLSGNLSGHYTETSWYVNESLYSTDTTAWFVQNSEGLYIVELIVSGCGDTLTAKDSIYVVASGLASTELSGVKVYPNPTEGHLIIETDFRKGILELYSYEGKLLESRRLEKGKNVQSLAKYSSGLYLLRIYNREGKRKVYRILKR